MTYIQIDSRGCGAGKTRNTIVPRIKNNIRCGIKTLLVVPSKELQAEYRAHFDFDEITIINSDNGKILAQYQTADTPVVCLTHQGFLQTPRLFKDNWDLVIDEVFDPYESIQFKTADSAGRVWTNFSEVFDWAEPVTQQRPTVSPQPFFKIKCVESTPPDVIRTDIWRKITNPNYVIRATWTTGDNLMNNVGQTATLYVEVDPEILKGWHSVWIAAAVFERTFMGAWMLSNRIDYSTVYAFDLHSVPAVFHMPTEEFKWSKACRLANPDIENTFRNYVNQHRSGKLIYNSNNDSNTVFALQKRLCHNAHGVNAYADRTDYAFMTAIQPPAPYANYLKEISGLSGKELSFALSGYTAYQLIMRTALRDAANTTKVNVFALDTEMLLGVMDLFDPYKYEALPNISVEDSRTKKVALTNAEKQKLYRQRNKAKTTP
tara:strand:- start:337 stop:1635 length:1299 start_codon:yes stop_codon:yes gene_type:complete